MENRFGKGMDWLLYSCNVGISPPPIHFQVNFDSFDGYILTGWNFWDLALKMTLQHDLQSLWPDCLARQSLSGAGLQMLQKYHLYSDFIYMQEKSAKKPWSVSSFL